jgi:hypothetical protein
MSTRRAFDILGLAALLIIGYQKAAPLFWQRIPGATVLINSTPLKNGRLYRQPNGDILVYPGNGLDMYVIRRRETKVGSTSGLYFWFVSSWGAMAKDRSDPSLNMMSAKNNFIDPRLRMSDRTASFHNMAGSVVELRW